MTINVVLILITIESDVYWKVLILIIIYQIQMKLLQDT